MDPRSWSTVATTILAFVVLPASAQTPSVPRARYWSLGRILGVLSSVLSIRRGAGAFLRRRREAGRESVAGYLAARTRFGRWYDLPT